MKKRLWVILSVLVAVLATGAFFTKDTIAMVLMGEGEVALNNFETNKELLAKSENFTDVVVKEEDGKLVLSGTSVDNTTAVEIVSDANKVESVKAVIDGTKLTEENAKAVILKNVDSLLSSVFSKKDARNLELYVSKEAVKQLKANPEKIVVRKIFGEVEIYAEGNLNTGEIQILLKAKKMQGIFYPLHFLLFTTSRFYTAFP